MISALATIETDVIAFFKHTGTDLEKFANAFTKLFKKAPSAIQMVENFTTETGAIVIAAVSIIDPEAEPEAAMALSTVEVALAGIEAAATAAVSGTSLVDNLTNFATTVPNLLTSIDVKNPVLKATIIRIVNLIVSESKVLIPAAQHWVAKIKESQVTIAPEPVSPSPVKYQVGI